MQRLKEEPYLGPDLNRMAHERQERVILEERRNIRAQMEQNEVRNQLSRKQREKERETMNRNQQLFSQFMRDQIASKKTEQQLLNKTAWNRQITER